MRIFLTLVAFLACFLTASSQTFNGVGGNIPSLATTQTCFNASVAGVGVINGGNGLVSVCMNISHADAGDLEIVLRAPDGTIVPLTMQNGGSGNNFNTTCFSATATTPIKFGSAPFNGSFLPEGHLGAVNNGQNANGTWSLCILDRRNNSGTGTVNSWSLTFGSTPAPVPPSLPGCANTLPSSSSCATATLVCDFNGQCGSTSGTSVQTWPALTAASCFSLQNNSFVKFIASATTASFSVWIPSTIRANYLDGGLQMLFFSATCNGPVTTYGCYEHIYPYSGAGQPIISVISASGLTPGNTYYLMIDGYNGDNCTFTIAANTGVNILNVTPAAPAICAGGSVNLTASGGNGVYSWSPATNLSSTSGSTVTANPPGNTTYTVTSTTAAGCPITKDVTVTVNPLPPTPNATVITQPTCTVPTGTISFTAPVGPGLEYSVGGSYQSTTLFTGLTPGSYIATVRNPATSCTSLGVPLTVNPIPPSPAAPAATVTSQPTCTNSTGTITVSAPTGAGLQYSINGGPYQPSPVFSGLAPNSYTITLQNAGGCTSAASAPLTVNPAPTAPVAPTGNITQPSCTTPTGSITITAPTGTGLQYSINGGPYQGSPVFTGLSANSYTVTAQDAGGCTSAVSQPFVISPAPAAPAAPTGNITQQPTCTAPTGTIVITAPTGPGLQYAINGGPFLPSTNMSGLAPGTYTVTVRDAAGCVSPASQPFVINPLPSLPTPPTASVTAQPDCTKPTGTITITAPTGANYEYSVTGAAPFQSSPVFNGLAPNTYNVIVRNITSGCLSQPLALTVNNGPAIPAAPSYTVAGPNCNSSTGTITVTAPLGAGLEYSLDGTTFQASPVFTNLAAGIYQLRVKNAAGCSSALSPVTVAPSAGVPATPVLTVTQPSCPTRVGSIRVDSPVGANIEYSFNGITYQSSNIFSNLGGGIFTITARYTGTSCVSASTVATLNFITPQECIPPANGDIYFPSAFTPNGDRNNDGFGPGPRTNLSAVSNYSLMVFNRYGELVFKTNDPYTQWNGSFKGKMLANNSYTWVSGYRYAGGAVRMKKGSVVVVR